MTFVVISLEKYEAQKKLKLANDMLINNQIKSATILLNEISHEISTSESFFRINALLYIKLYKFKLAQQSIFEALKFTASPNTLIISAEISEKLGNVNEAEKTYNLVCGIEPHRYLPRILKMQMYFRNNEVEKTYKIAKEIIEFKPKFNTKKVELYRKSANQIINNNIN